MYNSPFESQTPPVTGDTSRDQDIATLINEIYYAVLEENRETGKYSTAVYTLHKTPSGSMRPQIAFSLDKTFDTPESAIEYANQTIPTIKLTTFRAQAYGLPTDAFKFLKPLRLEKEPTQMDIKLEEPKTASQQPQPVRESESEIITRVNLMFFLGLTTEIKNGKQTYGVAIHKEGEIQRNPQQPEITLPAKPVVYATLTSGHETQNDAFVAGNKKLASFLLPEYQALLLNLSPDALAKFLRPAPVRIASHQGKTPKSNENSRAAV